jgi:hypothetical protein
MPPAPIHPLVPGTVVAVTIQKERYYGGIENADRCGNRLLGRRSGEPGISIPFSRRRIMKKLRLDVTDLQVERFQTDDGEMGGGTVNGHDLIVTNPSGCGTCYETCVTGAVRPCLYCP